jgi:hypothetical protein
MALKFWISGGTGNYNSTTNWSATSGGASGASVPTTADDVTWDANSGSGTVTINVASVAKSVNFTNFTGTVDFQNTLAVAGNITLGSGMSFTNTIGTPVLRVTAGATLTSNGIAFPYDFSVLTAAGTITLVGDWECNNFTHDVSTGNIVINGSTFFINGNLTNLNTIRSISGTTVYVMQGTGTLSSNFTTTGNIVTNLVFNTIGTITIIGIVGHTSPITWTYTSGTIITSGSTFSLSGATLDLNGMIWNNLIYNGVGNITHLSNFVYEGLLSTLSSSSSKTLNGFMIRHIGVIGGIVNQIGNSGGNGSITGTTILSFEGSGSLNTGGTGGNIGIPITVNTIGTYILNAITSICDSTFTYTSGTIDFSTIEIRLQQNNKTTTFNGISSLNFNLLNIGSLTHDVFIVLNDTMYVNTIDCANSGGTITLTTNRFSGTSAFVCNTFNIGGGRGQTIELQNGLNYQVNTKLETYPPNLNVDQFRTQPLTQPLIKSTINGIKANLTLNFGASQELMYLQFKDINALNGQTLWVFGSVSSVLNCDNINTFTQLKSVGF